MGEEITAAAISDTSRIVCSVCETELRPPNYAHVCRPTLSPEVEEAIGRIDEIAHHIEVIHDGAYLIGDGTLLAADLRLLIGGGAAVTRRPFIWS